MLYYCPFESRGDRYTMQLSAPIWGWNESAWRAADISYKRVEGYSDTTLESKGTIFDLPRRSKWCLHQVIELLRLYEDGRLSERDTIYFDDFLHPGIEALTLSIPLERRPKMYAWMHGTALDAFDMLYDADVGAVIRWTECYEMLNLRILDGVFVATPSLKDLVVKGYSKEFPLVADKVYATGHVWSTYEVKSRMPKERLRRENMVVFAARFDACKDPMMFLKLAKRLRDEWEGEGKPRFVVCTSSDSIKSDSPYLLEQLKQYTDQGYVEQHTGLYKDQYYELLSRSKVIFSSSRMDWTSYVLLEGVCAGAYPVFPYNHCFKDALREDRRYMYHAGSLESAAAYVEAVLLSDDSCSDRAIESRMWIYQQFDSTWDRRLSIMELRESYLANSPWGDNGD